MTDAESIHRAQLADMPLATIVAWLQEQGWVLRPEATHGGVLSVVAQSDLTATAHAVRWVRAYRPAGVSFARDRLPPGYPPRAEDDAPLPFEDGR